MESETPEKSKSRLALRVFLGVISLAFYFVAFFLLAGRLDWLQGWMFLILFISGQTVHILYMRRKNPETLRSRTRIGKNTKKWDMVWLAIFAVLYLLIMSIAALDAGRYGWSSMPVWLWPLGAALYLVFMAFVTWAMVVNPHFEKTVRIQHDRNHRVVDTGPYRIVRHPGYTGSIAGFILSPPFLLGSWWSMVPAGLTAVWLVFRTALEDRTLRKELEGYEEYAQRVRYRLIPLLW